MGLPKAPVKSLEQTLEWMSTAPEDIRDPKFLWGECWERFNTIQMPITSTKEYFDTAIKLAKASNDKSREGQSFPCGTARILAVEFCRTGSLDSLLQILDGVSYGWKNKEYSVNGGPNEPLSDDGSEIPLTQFWEEGEDLWHDDMTPPDISNPPHVRDRDVSEAPSEAPTMESLNSWHQKPPSSSISAEEHVRYLSQQNVDGKCEHQTENKKPPKKRMRFDDAARADNTAQPDDESDDYVSFPSHQPTASTQSASENPPKKRRKVDKDDTTAPQSPIVSDQAASGRRTEKRTRANDDCNDGRAVDDDMHRKRPNTDAEHNENGNHRPKHRRIQTPEPTPTLHITPPKQQTTDENMTTTKTKVGDKVKGSQLKSRRRISSPRVGALPMTRTLNTRSTIGAGPSTLWELDTSQPRKI
ncbi:hypothetical protein ACQKWADRAFT_322577 [Trichoderma austrokoningii]